MGFDEFFYTTLMRLTAFLVITAVIIGGVAVCHHHISYLVASLISFGVVFCGIFILDGDWIS